MSSDVRDYLRPIQTHRLGLPPVVVSMLNRLSPHDRRAGSEAMRMYEDFLRLIDSVLQGRVDFMTGERAAAALSHILLDAAFVYDRLHSNGLVRGRFPHDDLIQRIVPPLVNHGSDPRL